MYGPPDLRAMWDDSKTQRAVQVGLRSYVGGSPAERPQLYDLLSPIHHVTAAVPPSLSIIGESDQLVPADSVRVLGRALAAAGATHEEVYLPATDHAIDLSWGALNTQVARAQVRRFLVRYG